MSDASSPSSGAPSRPRAVELLLEHAAFARRLARALVLDDARADDVVQQTFVNALERPPRDWHRLRNWVATVVRSTASKLRREEQRRERREQRAASPKLLPSTSDVAAELAAQRELLDVVARLDEPYRSTIHARYFDEQTPTQIANTQGIPVRTVETRLRRGLERLRADLDARFGGGRDAWAGVLLGGSLVTAKTKGAGAIAASVLVLATAATIVVSTVNRGHAIEGGASAESPRAADVVAAPAADAAVSIATTIVAPQRTAVAKTKELVASVVTPEGEGVAGAVLILFRGEEVLADATSDVKGEATLPIQSSACELLVDPGCAPRRVVAVPADAELVEIALENDGVFSGRVTIDDVTPPEPVELWIDSDLDASRGVRLCDAAWCRLRKIRRDRLDFCATTREDGSFVFRGFALHRKFSVSLPVPYEDARTGREWSAIDEARENVEIPLRENPTIRGRLVERGGAPLVGWSIQSFVGSDAGCGSEPSATSDSDGRFRVFLHNKHSGATTFATIDVVDPLGMSIRFVEYDRSFDEGGDLGDVVVDASRRLSLDVRDDAGRSVDAFGVVVARTQGAKEFVPEAPRYFVDAPRARAGFLLPEETESVHVVAPGFAVAKVLPKPASAPVQVDLAPAAQLSLDVKDDRGASLPQCSLEVDGPTWPASWECADLVAAHERLGGNAVSTQRSEPPSRLRVGSNKIGRAFDLVALAPCTPLTLVVRDSANVEVLREAIVLEAGERRRLERTIASKGMVLTGTVHATDGAPLAGVRIDWSTDDEHVQFASTKGDGTFTIDGVRASKLTLLFRHEGYSWRRLQDVDVAATAKPLDVELKPGRSTMCSFPTRVVEPTDVWIELAGARAAPDGDDERPADGSFIATRDRRRRWIFDDLPESKLLLRVRVDGFTYAIAPTPSAEVSYPVPLRGPVEVEWRATHELAAGRTLRAIRLVPIGELTRATARVSASDAARLRGLARFEKAPPSRYAVAFVWSGADDMEHEEKSDVEFDLQADGPTRVSVAR